MDIYKSMLLFLIIIKLFPSRLTAGDKAQQAERVEAKGRSDIS